MSDPRRILEGDRGPGRYLLESAEGDAPSAEARSRAFASMMTAASEPVPPGRSGWRLSASKAIVALALVGAGAAVWLRISSRSESRPQAIANPSPPEAPALTPPPATQLEPPVVVAAPPHRRSPEDTLGEEVKLLDQVRSALGKGDVELAERALDRYEARFPHGRLSEESVSLRIRALLARNQKAEAKALATRFLAEHPQSPLVPRVRALLSQCE